MANGKFSKPRSHFNEESEVSHILNNDPPADSEEAAIEQAFLEIAEEEPGRDLPPVLENLLGFFGRNRKVVLICSCILLLAVLIGFIALALFGGASDPYDGRILNNVIIANVNVGGMTRAEAERAVRAETDSTFAKQDMVLVLPDTTLYLSPANTGAKLDVSAAVKAAYGYGRTGTAAEQQAAYENSFTGNHTIGLLPYLGLNTAYIQSVLEDYAASFGSVYSETTYSLQGTMPELSADKFDPDAPCQLLVIRLGTPGLTLDIDSIYNQILDAYSFNRFQVKVSQTQAEAIPEPLDLEAVYQELYIAPVNATLDSKTFEPIPGIYGYGFDLEAAQKKLDSAQYGSIVEIPMEYIQPEIMEDGVLFRDVLGQCQTPHTTNANRNANLTLACQMLNGVVLNPGETLSYNDTVGERTSARGFKPAPAYSGTNLVDSIGGGVCQVSSTLYYCALLSDLEIVDRINHGFPSSYIDLGMDATVNWGGPDFKFRNNTDYPIKIEAEVSEGYVKMRILGTDVKDYYVKMEYEIVGYNMPETVYEEHSPGGEYYDGQVISGGSMGPIVKTYRCKYSKETDELISRDYEVRSSYMANHKIIAKVPSGTETPGEGGETTPPSGGETEPPTGGTETPPTGGTETPPSGGTETPPTGGTETPPDSGNPPPESSEG